MGLVQDCLRAWRIYKSPYLLATETGFDHAEVRRVLTSAGTQRLPPTPLEDQAIATRVPITDLTEVLALRLLRQERPEIVLPYPRVFHKDTPSTQHHGIDLLGYFEAEHAFVLVVCEVMASAEERHPPSTVRQHWRQMVAETLDAPTPSRRLAADLDTLIDESGDEHQAVLAGFLVALLEDRLGQEEHPVLALPILVRPSAIWSDDDRGPFARGREKLDRLAIPARLWFAGVELDRRFSELLDLVKSTASHGQAG
ncbi:MAG: hypothetical protein ABIO70_30540 [Pseudomonadota bacterium]